MIRLPEYVLLIPASVVWLVDALAHSYGFPTAFVAVDLFGNGGDDITLIPGTPIISDLIMQFLVVLVVIIFSCHDCGPRIHFSCLSSFYYFVISRFKSFSYFVFCLFSCLVISNNLSRLDYCHRHWRTFYYRPRRSSSGSACSSRHTFRFVSY